MCSEKSHAPFSCRSHSAIAGRVDSALLSGLFHTLCLDDTSDIQPVVLLASRSISSQSGGVHLDECINGPPNLRQGYEAD